MSQLRTITSSTRPTVAPEGAVFFEQDTNRLLVYVSGAYHVFNRDTFSSSTGGSDELNYPAGLYTNSSAQYYVSTAPEVHLDTAHWNGVDRNGTDTPAANPNITNIHGTTQRSWDAVWFDRTNNKHPFFRWHATASATKVEERNGFDAFFGVKPTNNNYYRNDANNGGHHLNGTIMSTGSLTGLQGDWTVFAVIGVDDGSDTQWTWNLSWSHVGPAHITAGRSGDRRQINNVYANQAGSATGPRLIIKRNDASADVLSAWGAEDGGATAPATSSSTPTDFSDYLGLAANFDTAYELIFFKSALNIADINTVKDYLQNKYNGAGAPHFPLGGTSQLTES